MQLETDWVRIGTAGPTADGREIEAQWLDEMADSYDPKEYQALIWPDHNRFSGNYGKVTALRVGDDDKGRRILEAKLQPKPVLISLNRNGSYLFSSMEISPKNFGNMGKRYLVGLGVTDEPAALGMAELKLSKDQAEACELTEWDKFSLGDEDEKTPGWFTRFMKQLGVGQTPQTTEDNDMTKDDLESITSAIADGFSQLESAIAEKFAAMSEAQEERLAASNGNEETAEAEPAEADALIELKQQVADLAAKFEALQTTPVAGTRVPEHTGATGEVYT